MVYVTVHVPGSEGMFDFWKFPDLFEAVAFLLNTKAVEFEVSDQPQDPEHFYEVPPSLNSTERV